MSEIVHNTSYADEAEARLPEQYKGKPKLSALVRISGTQAQEIEDVLWDIYSNSNINNGHDYLLDQIGDNIKQPRNGLSDDDYKLRLFAKIAENVSDGTVESVIKLFKALMRADQVIYYPLYPAAFSMTAINPNPLGSIVDTKAAINRARIGGVSIDYIESAPTVAFSFFEDPDPNGGGFGDEGDASVGGTFAQVL